MPNESNLSSTYLHYLPAIFGEDAFMGRFLLAFERIMTGTIDVTADGKRFLDELGLEEIIERIPQFFDPLQIHLLFRDEAEPDPDKLEADRRRLSEFLHWMASWVALSLRADWTAGQQKNFLANIVPLYRSRGTRANLIKLLTIYTGGAPTIDEGEITTFQIGLRSTIGKDTIIGEPPAHFFRVTVRLGGVAIPAERDRKLQIARALIDLQKPAHTSYELKIASDTMKIGKRSTIGRDTLIGIEAEESLS